MFLPFEYYDPQTLAEFVALTTTKTSYKILAGGTDLLVQMRNGWKPCPHVIDIKKIGDLPELREIRAGNDGLYLGALVNFARIQKDPAIREKFTALHECAQVMGCLEIRNRATLGGNICNAGSGAEGGSPLLAFDSVVYINGQNGRRWMKLAEFYQEAIGKKNRPGVALESGELVTHFFLPFLPADSSSTYVRRARTRGMDLASLNLSLVVCPSNHHRHYRIASGAVAPIPKRFESIETLLAKAPLGPKLIEQVKDQLAAASNPRPGSKRASREYKKDQIGYLFELALRQLKLL